MTSRLLLACLVLVTCLDNLATLAFKNSGSLPFSGKSVTHGAFGQTKVDMSGLVRTPRLGRHERGDTGGFTRSLVTVLHMNAMVECTSLENDFKEAINTRWAVVDFYADWCGPCKIAAKTFGAVAKEYDNSAVRFIKVDTEVFDDTVDDYDLKGLPVFGVFKDGKLVKKHEGNIGKDKLIEFINSCMEA